MSASPSEKPQDEPERPEWLRVTDRTFYRVRGRRIEISEPSCRHWRRVDTIPACAVRVKR